MTEHPPGNVPSKHTFVNTCVLLTGLMTQGIKKQTLGTRSHYQSRF